MTLYIIIEADSWYDLQIKVNNYIKKGYKPQGGISICVYGVGKKFYQAMITDED